MDVAAERSAFLYGPDDRKRHSEVAAHPGFPDERYRSAWRRDYARLVHCPAFRRLQGKTQVFPGPESDFFRNRLTHSLEVAQIAKSIAIRLNNTSDYFSQNNIDLDLVETIALGHDLGHPPFGHNGERALDDCMKIYGGFEGNAQTLRILSRLEKKEKEDLSRYGVSSEGMDSRLGLNLTYRTLAGVLKYDEEIPVRRLSKDPLKKGYYRTERRIVQAIKHSVLGASKSNVKFRTIECGIMDIADDIAYSTYDLEDTLKAGFATPLHIAFADGEILERVARKAKKALGASFDHHHVRETLFKIFGNLIQQVDLPDDSRPMAERVWDCWAESELFSRNGYIRTQYTSDLVTEFVLGTSVDVNQKFPALSNAKLSRDQLEKVEVLKHFTFENTIMSSRLKVSEYRSYDIVKTIFLDLSDDDGHHLLPEDFRSLYDCMPNTQEKMRVICDFIAGMTDRYALEFYGRLCSETPESIFKPF